MGPVLNFSRVFVLTLVLATQAAAVDFLEAQSLHEQGRYEPALAAFERLAQVGNNKAQYNLALMLWQGQGTPVNRAKALAWARIAAAGGSDPGLLQSIVAEASRDEIKRGDILLGHLWPRFSPQALQQRIYPQRRDEPDASLQSPGFIRHNTPFHYPSKLLYAGHEGRLIGVVWIWPDGSVRRVSISYSSHELYSKAVIRRMLEAQAQPYVAASMQQVPAPMPLIHAHFHGSNNPEDLPAPTPRQQNYINRLRSAAAADQPEAVLKLANDGVAYPRMFLEETELFDLYLRSAQYGSSQAAFELSKLLRWNTYGNWIDQAKGTFWLNWAAQGGDPSAQYALWREMSAQATDAAARLRADVWLQRSADALHPPAVIDRALQVAATESSHEEDFDRALQQLEDVLEVHVKTPDWLRARAWLLHRKGDQKKAAKVLSEALEWVQTLGWDAADFTRLMERIEFAR